MAAFDAHAHLQDPRIADPGALLARAWAAGVTDIVCCGTEEGDWEAVLALAKAHAGLRPMLGLHPWRVTGASPAWRATLEGLLRASAAGVGECGLDFAMRGADRTAQAAALRFQLGLAQDLGRPVALHCVRAWGPLTELLREVGVPRAGALVHGFGGSADTARELQALGVHLSFSAAFLDPRRTKARAALLAVAEAWLLLESDAPDGPPTLNEPAGLPRLIEAAARLRGVSTEDMARRTRENGMRLLGEVGA